jgi:hypothetical protein
VEQTRSVAVDLLLDFGLISTKFFMDASQTYIKEF